MTNSQFTLTSNSHEKNLCSGLSYMQQNGEFLDMTLAADGHFVKVHKIIIAIASPYIKDLIASTQCQHPIIFLNKISHTTLSAMLEYIYTGEVLVTMDNLKDLVQAGRDLHIKGLENVRLHNSQISTSKCISKEDENKTGGESYFDTSSSRDGEYTVEDTKNHEDTFDNTMQEECQEMFLEEELDEDDRIMDGSQVNDDFLIPDRPYYEHVSKNLKQVGVSELKIGNAADNNTETSSLQYTVSNQGSLQMILNRYMYYLKYTNRNKSRQWRCVDYLKSIRCPAHVITRDDVIIQRISAHTHPFHDGKILKKLKEGAIFSAILEAEKEGEKIQRNKDGVDENRRD